jgi:hypothetical protein
MCSFIIARPQQAPLLMNNRVPSRNHSDTQSLHSMCVLWLNVTGTGSFYYCHLPLPLKHFHWKLKSLTHQAISLCVCVCARARVCVCVCVCVCNIIETSENIKYCNWNKPCNQRSPCPTGNTRHLVFLHAAAISIFCHSCSGFATHR